MRGGAGRRVCLLTTAHLCSNPRLVKEADALAEAGYRVEVVGAQTVGALIDCDAALAGGRPWRYFPVCVAKEARPARAQIARLMRRVADIAPEWAWDRGWAERALFASVGLLEREASAHPADLYVAHNLGALPAARRTAGRIGARLGFDAEDFHSGELAPVPENARAVRRVSRLEKEHLPACDYLTAASRGIARAYVQSCGVAEPTTILNVFPLSEALPAPVEADFRPAPSLYWFSQTVGPDRGLEDAARALGAMKKKAWLALRGTPSEGYWSRLSHLARESGAEDRLRLLAPAPPEQMVPLAARHDIGLALEQPVSPNREICVTNKLFTYLAAGVPVAATATPGQKEAAGGLTDAVSFYEPGDWKGLASLLDRLLADPDSLSARRRAAWKWAREVYNWDLEKRKFLDVVDSVLGG